MSMPMAAVPGGGRGPVAAVLPTLSSSPRYHHHHHHRHCQRQTSTTMIRVIAPATLPEGYTFDVTVPVPFKEPQQQQQHDNRYRHGRHHHHHHTRVFAVHVPPGGVKEGQEFDVPYDYESDLDEENDNDNNDELDNHHDCDIGNNDRHHDLAAVVAVAAGHRGGRNHIMADDDDESNVHDQGQSGSVIQYDGQRQQRSRQSERSIESVDDDETNASSYVNNGHDDDNTLPMPSNSQEEDEIVVRQDGDNHPERNDSKRKRHRVNRKSSLPFILQRRRHQSPSLSSSVLSTSPPYGHWRHGLCACCDVITQSTFWMALCCPTVLIAQLVTRLKLNWYGRCAADRIDDYRQRSTRGPDSTNDYDAGQPNRQHIGGDDDDSDDVESTLSFNRIVLSLIVTLVVGNLLPGLGTCLVVIYVLAVVVGIGSNVRKTMRQRYGIFSNAILPTTTTTAPIGCCGWCACRCRRRQQPPSSTTTAAAGSKSSSSLTSPVLSSCDDCIVMCCCGCCALIQMARHTHNDKDYPGYACTTHGLPPYAPI